MLTSSPNISVISLFRSGGLYGKDDGDVLSWLIRRKNTQMFTKLTNPEFIINCPCIFFQRIYHVYENYQHCLSEKAQVSHNRIIAKKNLTILFGELGVSGLVYDGPLAVSGASGKDLIFLRGDGSSPPELTPLAGFGESFKDLSGEFLTSKRAFMLYESSETFSPVLKLSSNHW